MKKFFIPLSFTLLFLLLSLFFISETKAQNTTYIPQGSFHYGATGSEVERLQDALVVLGYLQLSSSDYDNGGYGSFGPKTRAALAQYQADNGIFGGNNGYYYGPQTRQNLQDDLSVSASSNPNSGLAVQPTVPGANGGISSNGSTQTSPPPVVNGNPTQSNNSTANPPASQTTTSCFKPTTSVPSYTLQARVTYFYPGDGSFGGWGTATNLDLHNFVLSQNSPYFPYPCRIFGAAAVDPHLIPYGSLIKVSTPSVGDFYYIAADTGPDVVSRKASIKSRSYGADGKPLPIVDLFSQTPNYNAFNSVVTITPKFFTISGGSYNVSGGSI
ncbi:MAG TPA: peptidoglycan-binding protein [Candidatus Paceibacterota bacterium]|nr:peptidoglycan-binding protein [Candidatus Paceibacterota bacterium]